MFRTWKKRFFAIVQFSEYRFLLCHFKPKTSHPKQLLVLEGYVADVAEAVLPTGMYQSSGNVYVRLQDNSPS